MVSVVLSPWLSQVSAHCAVLLGDPKQLPPRAMWLGQLDLHPDVEKTTTCLTCWAPKPSWLVTTKTRRSIESCKFKDKSEAMASTDLHPPNEGVVPEAATSFGLPKTEQVSQASSTATQCLAERFRHQDLVFAYTVQAVGYPLEVIRNSSYGFFRAPVIQSHEISIKKDHWLILLHMFCVQPWKQ